MRYQMIVTCVVLSLAAVVPLAGVEASEQGERALDEIVAGLGWDSDAVSVLFSWQERPLRGSEEMVTGLRVVAAPGGDPFDVYVDDRGAALSAADLDALGILPKNWTPRAISLPAEITIGLPKSQKALPPAPKAAGLPIYELTLPPIDRERITLEDESRAKEEGKGVLRIGVIQELAAPILVMTDGVSDGAWQPHPDGGHVWSLALRSPGALGQRLHFASLTVPSGCRVIVYDTDNPEDVQGPLASAEDFWAPTCFGESVVIECYRAEGAGEGLLLEIDSTTHHYHPMPFVAKEGTCHIDVNCEEAWRTAALAVGGLGSVSREGALFCTGSLLADEDHCSTVPYLLTANHCVGSATAAGNLEVYWLFQTDVCGGSIPSLLDVPRTVGGADLLATSSATSQGNDFSLLRLRQNPPDGLSYLGFTTRTVNLGEQTACIHHPQGTYKRISFGSVTDDGSPSREERMQPAERYHEVLWSEATTEGGSSGSPLFLEGTQTVIGQLWGGLASCTKPEEPDYYGRFDFTYPLVEQWLSAEAGIYDVDCSGSVNAADVQRVVNALLGVGTREKGDIDRSGAVDAGDLQSILNFLVNGG